MARFEVQIQDPFKRELRDQCHCEGGRDLDMFECYIRRRLWHDCGMLLICLECEEGGLFLKDGSHGKFRVCSHFKFGCKFHKKDINHAESKNKYLTPEQKELIAGNREVAFTRLQGRRELICDQSSSTTPSAGTKRCSEMMTQDEPKNNSVTPLTPKQKERIAANRAAVFSKLWGRKILYDHNSSSSPPAGTKRSSEVTSG